MRLFVAVCLFAIAAACKRETCDFAQAVDTLDTLRGQEQVTVDEDRGVACVTNWYERALKRQTKSGTAAVHKHQMVAPRRYRGGQSSVRSGC